MNIGYISDQCRNHDFEILNQSISEEGALIIRRPNIRTSYPMHGSSQPSVFGEPSAQINCSQSVKMKIWCCQEICQICTTRDICWYRFGYLGRPTVWKILFVFYFLKIKFLLNTRWKNFISDSFHLRTQGKIKFKIRTNVGGILERFMEGTFGRTWLARFHHV